VIWRGARGANADEVVMARVARRREKKRAMMLKGCRRRIVEMW
jgi:hypothetical protein